MAYDPMQELQKLGQPQQPQQGSQPGVFALGDNQGGGTSQTQPAGPPATFNPPGQATPPAPFRDLQPIPPVSPGGGLEGTNAARPTPTPGIGPDLDAGGAWGQLSSQFQNKFGRAMSAQEADALKSYAGYGGDATVSRAMLDKAQQGINAYSGNLSNPFGPATPDPTNAAPSATNASGLATNDMVQQELQQLMQTGSTQGMTLDANNPAIQAQRSAFNRANSQQTGRERLALAERAAASNGLGSGGFSADIAGAENARQGRAADFEGQLLGQELQGQRERVMRGIELANQSGNAAASRALQEKLGLLDANIRQTGQRGQLGLGMLQTLLGNQRAQDALGFNYAQLGVNANQNWMNSLLGAIGG